MPRRSRLSAILSFPKRVLKDFSDDNALSLAAALAYYTALSFAPLVLLLATLGGFLGESGKSQLLGMFSKQLGPRAADITEQVVSAAQAGDRAWWQTALSTVGLLITASAVFAQLQASLNRMWGVVVTPAARNRKRSLVWEYSTSLWRWLRKRLICMGMVMVVLFILLVSLVLSAALGRIVPSGGGEQLSARLIEFAASFLVATLLFAAIYKFLPDTPIAWRNVWLGALVTSLLFNLGKLALAVYIDKGGVGSNYGAAVGALIALLVWVYYSAAALLLGAEITQELAQPQGRPAPRARAAPSR